MPACPPTSDAACRVDVRILALAIPAIGLAPDALTRADWDKGSARAESESRAWAWQHGTTLIVLDQQVDGSWLLAELGFNQTYGYYIEQRRAAYAWPREAIGAALSRLLGLGNGPSFAAVAALDAWCGALFAEQPVSS
jgi:hypothetical protein